MANKKTVRYDKKILAKICTGLSVGKSLKKVCYEQAVDMNTVWRWLMDYPEAKELYDNAKRESGEAMGEEMLEIAEIDVVVGDDKSDNARVQQQRLRVDTRKWLMSKLMPRKYGDKVDITTNGKDLPTPLLGGQTGNK